MHTVTFNYKDHGSKIIMYNVSLVDLGRVLDWYNNPDPNEYFYYRTKEGDVERMFELSGKDRIEELQINGT